LAFELHCDAVDINRVGDVNILSIIVFASEVDNGALGGVKWHYKCGHIIATLHSNVTVDDLAVKPGETLFIKVSRATVTQKQHSCQGPISGYTMLLSHCWSC